MSCIAWSVLISRTEPNVSSPKRGALKDSTYRASRARGAYPITCLSYYGQSFRLSVKAKKCVKALHALNLSALAGCTVAATCNYGGAGKWRDEYNAYFAGKQVVLLPDNDDPGRKHMISVARALKPVADEVKMIELPDLPPEGGDVVDFISARGGSAAQDLLKLIEAAPVWAGLESAPISNESSESTKRPRLMKPSEILALSSQKLDWLVQDLLLSGGLSLVGAKPKVGKSTYSRFLGVCVARGEPFLGLSTKQGSVIYVCMEDSYAIVGDHIRKLGLTDADPITFLTGKPTHEQLRDEIQRQRPALVIIDPLARYGNVKRIDDYMENMRAIMPLEALCKEFGVAICVVHHTGKALRDDPFDAFIGSTSIFGGVETGVVIVRDPHTNVRKISSRSRHGRDLDETLLVLDKDTGRLSLGQTTETVRSAERHEKVRNIESEIVAFVSARRSCTEDEIKTAITGKATDTRNALANLVASEVLVKTGKGIRGDPYHYSHKSIPVETTEEGNGESTVDL
jgi:hypothetical protein